MILLAWGVGMGATSSGAGTPSTPAGTLPLMGVGR
jgi:hypothetical protein